MKAYIFPGQGSQFVGMGKDLYESAAIAKMLFDQANEILGFSITDVMFEGAEEDLKQTKITQPAIFLHSIAKAQMAGDSFQPDAVAGHSLGEFSALVAAKALSFEAALVLVYKRAMAMQKACEIQPSTMAAVLGLADDKVEEICASITDDLVVPANYNCPGQLVISGTISGVEKAVALCKEAGALKAVLLQVGGAFHSPLMQPAQEELAAAINATAFNTPICPIYQNVNALAETDPAQIKLKLIQQLTAPVRWTQTMQNMIQGGVSEFVEVGGTGKVLQGLVKKIDRAFPTSAL
ncbi:ACP S-malonyltransferase [Haliscomenobacter hydrossis]|uniref:Malonyl CoA-acyl carrier protein transacylase n=1 Tax=Haliscomenobacter hydrossis (strain ATCC 27775 / DSM 1100 / LMG 10767 / O) TaxID=760192 RepID=F4KRJ5_HALH1|nr:ACP S-malonyltransferase [Haliscomenobacter hydrossis]AEE48984.1 malonyl CoA-acyl carrier protein transacylase [Haliscomenobacter hydrossis DSM 1100]